MAGVLESNEWVQLGAICYVFKPKKEYLIYNKFEDYVNDTELIRTEKTVIRIDDGFNNE